MDNALDLEQIVPIFDEEDLAPFGTILDKPEKEKEIVVPKADEAVDTEEVVFEEEEEAEKTVVDVEKELKNPLQQSTQESIEEEETEETIDAHLLATVDVLNTKGVIMVGEDEKVESWEDLDAKISELPERIRDSIIEEAPDITKKLLEFAFETGKDLTKGDLKEFINIYLEDLSTDNIDISNDETAREFLKKVYKEKGLRDSVVEASLDSLEDEDTDGTVLREEASKELAALQKANKHQQLIDNKKTTNTELVAKQKQFVKQITEELEGTGWKPTKINTIRQQLVGGVTARILSQASNSSKGLIQLANLASYWNDKTKEFDFETFIKQVASKEVSSIKKSLTEDAFSSATSKTKINTNKDNRRNNGTLFSQLKTTN